MFVRENPDRKKTKKTRDVKQVLVVVTPQYKEGHESGGSKYITCKLKESSKWVCW